VSGSRTVVIVVVRTVVNPESVQPHERPQAVTAAASIHSGRPRWTRSGNRLPDCPVSEGADDRDVSLPAVLGNIGLMSNHQLTRWVLRHPWSRGLRRAGLGAAAVLAAGVLLIAPTAVSRGVPVASADDCPDVEVTFARGTDEPPGVGRVGQALVDSLRQQTGMNIGVYPVNYKASLLQLHTDAGSNDAVSHIKSMADKCPNTPQVLGGYSQGASVMDIVTGVSAGGILRGSALPAQYANMVAAVVTFGNVADRSGGPITTQSPLFGSRAIDLCNPSDPICHAGPGNDWSGHTQGYVPIYTDQAASFVAARLLAVQPPTTQPPTTAGPSATLAPSTAAESPIAFH
jgi:cutinase